MTLVLINVSPLTLSWWMSVSYGSRSPLVFRANLGRTGVQIPKSVYILIIRKTWPRIKIAVKRCKFVFLQLYNCSWIFLCYAVFIFSNETMNVLFCYRIVALEFICFAFIWEMISQYPRTNGDLTLQLQNTFKKISIPKCQNRCNSSRVQGHVTGTRFTKNHFWGIFTIKLS